MTTTNEARTPGAIRSLIPARIDRLPWSPFHTRMVVALGVAWILDGLEITVASGVVALLTEKTSLGLSSTQAGALASVYLAGRGRRSAVLRPDVGQAGPQEAVRHHARRLPAGQRPHRPDAQQRRGLAGLPVRHPLHQRHGHRRRVRGDQLRDRRADPRPVPRPRRHHGQRHLLGRRDHRHARHPHLPQPALAERRLAARLPARPGARPGDHLRPPAPAGEPALAGHARPRGRGRGDDRLHRARGRAAAAASCRGCPRTRRSRSSRPRTSATSRWPGCCSRSTRSGRSTAPR